MKFREHRGSLSDAMKTVIEVNSLLDIEKLFPNDGKLKIEYYCYDDRINWNTYIVIGELGVIGFTNGNLK